MSTRYGPMPDRESIMTRSAPGGAGYSPVAVKIGGSLACSEHLGDWLSACRAACLPLAIVPGGGPFADAVRSAQTRMGLGDAASHRMALLAMAQYGEALASLAPGFVTASSQDEIHRALDSGQIPVWIPLDILSGADGVEESWDVTSDTLAAWLAVRLGSKTLVLVKHEPLPENSLTFEEMADAGLIDRALPAFLANHELRVIWLGSSEAAALNDRLAGTVLSPRPVAEQRATAYSERQQQEQQQQ